METVGCCLALIGLIFESVLLWRAHKGRFISRFPLFYSYVIYVLCCSSAVYAVYWIRPIQYASAYWFYFLICILAEFAVLVEISDHIFQPFPAIRHLGRALTILISVALGVTYILPTVFQSHGMRRALLDFALRTSLTKAVILAVLLYAARHFDLKLGRNVAGLMLGFSIYLGVNVANFAAAESFSQALYARILWVMSPIAYTFCLLVWTVALWKLARIPRTDSVPPAAGRDSDGLALELARINSALSKFLHR
jgi:hypothetical protein